MLFTVISTVATLMKIRYKPGIYHVELHSKTGKEPLAAVVCFSFFRQTQITAPTESFSDILGYTVIELKHITTKSTNQSRVHVFMYVNPTLTGRAKTKGCRCTPGHSSHALSREPIFLSVRAFSSSSTFEGPSRVILIQLCTVGSSTRILVSF